MIKFFPCQGTKVAGTQVEVMHMVHKQDLETRLVKGLVMDHGGRHPGMPSD